MRIATDEFGRVDVVDLPVAAEIQVVSATYTHSGSVFLFYRTETDPAGENWFHAAVTDDEGRDFRTIFSGSIPQRASANGIRHMPMTDNRRVLLGDYVLECSPDIDSCDSTELINVEYPWGLVDDPRTMHHWSEIIVSPDCEHIAWTILRTDLSAIVAIGRLRREEDRYVIEQPVIISSTDLVEPDPQRDQYFTTTPMRGGEVKQFVRGGTAISSVGDGGRSLTDSIIQDLTTETVIPITRTPGYDETTILSPDERLGIVMTSRASAQTNPAVLGLLPRPHANLVGMHLARTIYQYTVGGVRAFRAGNVGPVLIDIERSMSEPGYQGIALNSDDPAWVYCSPMSWHPSGRSVMWMEMLRGSDHHDESQPQMRVRKARLLDRTPSAPVATGLTPDEIPYGVNGAEAEEFLRRQARLIASGNIAGEYSGRIAFEREPEDVSQGRPAIARVEYVDFSNDGRTVYNGYEYVTSSLMSGTVYEADLELTGDDSGEMRLRAAWSGLQDHARLLFDPDSDGAPKSRGFARYRDTLLEIDDLVE